MDVDFNAYLILLGLWFVGSLIIVRCFLAVVNRCFLLVDYAQEKLYPGGKKQGGKFGVQDLIGMAAEIGMPLLKQKVQGMMGVTPK